MAQREDVRNVAIIAHVDHGKTTLVDGLLKEAGSFRKGEVLTERAMDSNDLERERGITILSKCTSVTWKNIRINLVDTPGHADFGGEVERVLGMVDAVILLVDANEGPMPQTRFVTMKAFELNLPAILVVNKIDRPRVAPDEAVDKVFDLFASLGATDEQLDFPVVYASAKMGFAINNLTDEKNGFTPLLDLIVDAVPPAPGDEDAPLCMQCATLAYDDFLGYMAIGRVKSGTVKVGDRVLLAQRDGGKKEFRVQKVLGFQGLKRFELEQGRAGDIIALTGMNELNVGETITSITDPIILPTLKVDSPTMVMEFRPNDSPFAGTEGKFVTSRNIRERLMREIKSNIALQVEESDEAGVFRVSGRGELHLSILIETMRREGFELCVSPPKVITKRDEKGNLLEPWEDVTIELEEEYSGTIIEEMGRRLGTLNVMEPAGEGRQRLVYRMPARGLIGYRSAFLTATRGTGTISNQFAEYAPYGGKVRGRQNGVLVALEQGTTSAYSLHPLQDRGILFIGNAVKVYGGMIVGENAKVQDLVVNPNKAKALNNIRTHSHDDKLVLAPPRNMTLEIALEFINDDELVEVTPENIRLRKKTLDHSARKREDKAAAAMS